MDRRYTIFSSMLLASLALGPPIARAQDVAVERAGHVVRNEGRHVLIDLGTDDGIQLGTHVQATIALEVSLDGEPGETQRSAVAVGRVVSVSARHAQVAFGVNERIPNHAELRPTDAPQTASLAGPPRVGGLFEIAGTLTPFLVVGDLGGGGMVDASLTYRGGRPFFLRATVGPVGFTSVSSGTDGFGSGAVVGGFDHRFLEVGLGVGLMLFRRDGDWVCMGLDECDRTFERSMRPALAASARFGVLDGLHGRIATTLVVSERAFGVGTLDVTLQVPMAQGVWLLAQMGGAFDAGEYWYAGAAVRALLRGDGGPGSFYFTGGLRWTDTRTFENPYSNYNIGLAPALGVEYRR